MFDGFGKKAAAKMGVGIFLIFLLGGVLFLSEAAAATGVIYVKSDAVGEGDGTSWEDAYTQLHDAIEAAVPGDRIWIASGTYVPTQLIEGSEDVRTAHYHMKNNVEIYGGFAGDEDPATFDLEDRDFAANETVLSGDIQQDDVAGNAASMADNAYHVFYHADNPFTGNLDETAVLDGVTISGGNANDPDYHSHGGGMYNDNNDPTVRNVTFKNNRAAIYGGAVFHYLSAARFYNVRMVDNVADIGGGLYSQYGESELINLDVRGNTATGFGGGMYMRDDHSTLAGTLVSGNYSTRVGGIYIESSDLTLVNLTISGNKADNSAGGIFFAGEASESVTLYNSIVCGNTGGSAEDYYGDVRFQHSINAASSYGSCLDLENNIVEPADMFVDPLNADLAPSTAGDYRLIDLSPADSNTFSLESIADESFYREGGILSHVTTDLEGKPRFIDNKLEIGAYESPVLFIFVWVQPFGTGTATGAENFLYYYGGSPLTLTAIPNEGYGFVKWVLSTANGVELSREPVITHELTGTTDPGAFIQVYFGVLVDVGVTSASVVEGTVTGGGEYAIGQEITILASPSEGYHFVNWTEDGAVVSTDASYTFEVTGDQSLVANFEMTQYTVTYDGNGHNSGSMPIDNETYGLHDSVAVSDNTGNLGRTGYTFAGWNTEADGSGTSYTPGDIFSMGADNVTLYAEWVDNIAPATTVHMAKEDESPYTNDTWTNQTVTVSVYATDEGSGLASLAYSEDGGASWQPVAGALTYSEEGMYTLTFKAIDEEGNEGLETRTVKINRNGLVVTFTASTQSGDPYVSGNWTNQTVTADVYASHQQGIAVTSIAYSQDDGASWSSYTEPLVITGTGTHTIKVIIQDEAGNELEDALTVKIDQVNPIIEFGTDGEETWSLSGSTSVSVSDTESGVNPDSLAYVWSQGDTAPADGWETFANGTVLTISGVDGDWYLHIRAQDALGHTADAVSERFRLDSSAAELNGLALSAGTLNPAFDASTMDYKARVASSVSSITVTPVTPDATDILTVSINGGTPSTVASGDASEPLVLHAGANTVEIEVTALNGARNTYSIAVTHAASSSGTSGGSSEDPSEPEGKASLLVDSTVIGSVAMNKGNRSDGAVIEQVSLDEEILDEALNRLDDVGKPILTIQIDDSERVVLVQLPATSIAAAAETSPNETMIEVVLNGASYQLAIRVLDLAALAERLGVELKDLKVNIMLERADEATETQIRQLAVMEGFDLVSAVIDFKVTVEANGQTVEIRDFGGTYMARAIVTEEGAANRNLTGVLYDRETKTFTFVPSRSRTRSDGAPEMVMHVPHNSTYAVLESKGRTFDDLSGHWAKADVELLASKLIVHGVTDSRFAPNADITRAEFTALLVRALGLSLNPDGQASDFADVAANAWYRPAVEAAVDAGLASGLSPDRYAPNERITREQMAVMVAKALSFAGKEAAADRGALVKFTDRTSISGWAADAVAQAVAAGILNGMPDGTFAPSDHATRAQATAVLKRFLQYTEFI